MDVDSSIDGTLPATSLPLGESIDQMGDLLQPEQVDDNQFDLDFERNSYQFEDDNDELDMDITDHIDQPEDDNDDFSVDAIGLDGATRNTSNYKSTYSWNH